MYELEIVHLIQMVRQSSINWSILKCMGPMENSKFFYETVS